MAENIIAEIRHILQDVLVPDFKALTTRVDGGQKYTELAIKALEAKIEAGQAKIEAGQAEIAAFRAEFSAFRAEMSAFRAEMRSEFQAQRNLLQNEVLRETGPIRERLATLEARSAHS
jgi:predicted RNase H-like nuclease (RuvC/YqgF family)